MKKDQRYVVRAYFLSEGGELLCADTRPLWYRTAHRLAARLKQADHECLDAEVLTWRGNCVRPPPDGIRRVADIASKAPIVECEVSPQQPSATPKALDLGL